MGRGKRVIPFNQKFLKLDQSDLRNFKFKKGQEGVIPFNLKFLKLDQSDLRNFKFKNNSFWAFQEDSDDDNDNMNANDGRNQSMGGNGGTATMKKKLASPFQFAAPSFVVPNHSNDNGVQVDSAAVDPDL